LVSANQGRLEELLENLTAAGERAEQVNRMIGRKLIRLRMQAEQGNLHAMQAVLESLFNLTKDLGQMLQSMDESVPANPSAYLNSGAYRDELRAAAEAAGLAIFEENGRLLSPPSVLRVLPRDMALEIDGQKEFRLRPSLVIGQLAERQRRPKFGHTGFLNSLREAYDLVVARNGGRSDAVVRLIDIWHVLTLLPGRGKEYTRSEFTRDLYLLDKGGVTSTLQSDRQLRWCASSGTRSQGLLSTIDAEGRTRHYWGIAFVAPPAAAPQPRARRRPASTAKE
jgi:hypothetical protein